MKNLCTLCLLILLASNVNAQVGIGTVSPNSTLDVRGSFSAIYRSFTASTTASSTDHTLVFTGTTASTLTLPDATACAGRVYMIKNASTTGPVPVVTIATTSSQTIDGITSWLLDQAYESVIVVSNGANWIVSAQNASASSGTWWALGGNSVASIQNFGTTSNFDLPFITNNTEKMRLSASGNLGIGASAFNATNPEKLLVQAGTTASFNLMQGHGKINNYLQLNVQNDSAGLNSSSDVVATANNGTETINYVDMGINSSANTQNVMGSANDAYLYSTGNNFLIGNGTASKSLVFMTGGTTQSANERMRIDGSGNVGIGTNSPGYLLHVAASANPLYLGGVQTGLNTDSLLTIINGVVRKLSPSTLATSSSNAWALVGNNNTLASNYFLGTTNTDPLIIKINSQLSGRIDAVNTFLGYQSGFNNSTTATQSTGIGYHALNLNTSGTYNTAIGYNSLPNNATGSNNIGIGNNADVSGNSSNSILIGSNSYTTSSNAIALGISSQAVNTYALALGNNTYSSGANAIAIGSGPGTPKTQAQGASSIALGYNAYSGGTSSIAIGTATNTSATNAVVIGNNASTSQANSIILGDATNNSVDVGIGTATPGAKLHIYATTGNNPLLLQGVPTGATSDNLLTINTSTGVVNSLPYSSFANSWNLSGNTGTNSVSNFIGTADNHSLSFSTNNTQRMYIDSATGNVGVGTNTPASNFTLFQKSGSSPSQGMRFTGNSIGGTNSGTGFLMSLGNNVSGNKQLWAGDPDYAGNASSTFIRFSAFAGGTTLNAVAGDGSVRRPIAIGEGGDPLSGIIFGNDGSETSPGSYVWDNGNMAIGNSYRTNAAPANGLIVQGNVGIGTPSPATALHVVGTNPLTLIGVQTGVNTDSILTIINGVVRKLSSSAFALSSNTWALGGNSVASVQTLGTTSNFDLPFITNNTEKMRISSAGNVGIGASAFNATNPEKLLVQAGTTTSFNLMQGHGKTNNYLQLNVQNDSAGVNSSSDVVATADNGTELINYVDMGINSSLNTQNVMGSANDAYLYTTGNNFLIGTGTASKSLVFMTGGTTQSSNERMRINGSGNVGIANTNPLAVLDVNGTVKVGTAGSILNSIIRFTNQSLTDNTTFDFSTGRTETFTLTGVTQYATVIITPRSALPIGMVIAYAYASAANTVKLNLQTSSSSTSLGTVVFDITVIQ